MLFIGQKLVGRYIIEALLGEGGMGAVYRAQDILHNRKIAIKEFRLGNLPSEADLSANEQEGTVIHRRTPTLLTREKALEQFTREAQLLSSLKHPNIPEVFDFFILEPEGYIAMTLIEGRNLAVVLEENGEPIPEETVCGWLAQILDALAYCHDHQVIHRDLKPENLLLTDENKIFLVDFGIAKPVLTGQTATTTGARAYSPGFAPPEQYAGQGKTDYRSDLYSLGAVAYYLLTAEPPMDAAVRMTDDVSPEPRTLNPTISIGMESFIQRCMQIRKAERPQSASEAIALLKISQPDSQGVNSKPPHTSDGEPAPEIHPEAGFPGALTAPEARSESLETQKQPTKNTKWLKWMGSFLLGGLFIWLVIGVVVPGINQALGNNHATQTAIMEDTLAKINQTAVSLQKTEVKKTESADILLQIEQTSSAHKTSQAIETIEAQETIRAEQTAIAAAWTDTPTVTPSATRDPLIPPECTQIGQVWVSPVDGMTLVCVPAGEFMMGNHVSNAWQTDEFPSHIVFLDSYWIDKYEVTNGQFANYLNTDFPINLDLRIENGNVIGGSNILYRFLVGQENWVDLISFENGNFQPLIEAEDLPVVFVTWYGAQAYCDWAGRGLPTEAQWEKAARGLDERQYPWGNDWDSNKTNSVMNDPFSQISPIGSFPDGISPYGALDMSGNVWEWVADYYESNFYQYSPLENPTGPTLSTEKVLRGGSWEDSVPFTLRITDRYNRDPRSSLQDYGFRCAYPGQ